MGLAHRRSLVTPCFFLFFSVSLSLSLPLFFRLIPWNTEALCVHFPAWASKTLLAFYVNQGISASFYFLIYNILSLSLSKSFAHAVSPSVSPGSCRGWTPALTKNKKLMDVLINSMGESFHALYLY